MKFSIRTFVLAAIAALSFAATTHSASAQLLYADQTPADHVLPYDAVGTINAVIVPYAGTYVFSGLQTFIVEGTGSATITCWLSTVPGSRSGQLRDAPLVSETVQAGGTYVTLPLQGYFSTSAQAEIWVECEYSASSTATTVESLTGDITAVSVAN